MMPALPQLRRLREERALSQRDLAEMAGVSQATIVHIEKGQDARHITVRKLAKALAVEPAELMRAEISSSD
jgi:predicted transcriptional regulator